MTIQLFAGPWSALLKLGPGHHFQVVFRYAFRRSFTAKVLNALPFNNYPVTPAIFSTLKYRLLRDALSLLEPTGSRLTAPIGGVELRYNLYYFTNPSFLSRATQYHLRAATFKFLAMSLLG
jgi:hypothetical protein